MSKVVDFFRRKAQWEPETADQKAVIRELHKLHSHVDVVGHIDEDANNEKQYQTFVEDTSPPSTTLDVKDDEVVVDHQEREDDIKNVKIVHMDGVAIHYIGFEKDDPEDPYNWSKLHKAFCVFIMMFLTFIGGVAGASLSSGITSMKEELHTNLELARFGYSIFIFGFAVGPLVTSPLAEDYGRWPCYMAGIFAMLIFSVPVGAAHNIAVVIVFRFIGGFIGSVASSMISGTIADIYTPNDRGIPMLWHTIVNFVGNVAAPVSFGYVGWKMSFRWIMWILIMACGLTMLLMFLFMEETRAQVILQKRANRVQKLYGGPKKVYLVSGKIYIPMRKRLATTLQRPIIFLFTEPVVGWFSLWMGITWGMIYICFSAVPAVMEKEYGFNPGEASLVFIAEIVGVFIGAALDLIQQRWYQKYKQSRGPEARLFMSCIGGILVFAGILIFGLTQGRTHWMGPTCGLAILLVGVVAIFQAISLYFADCYGTFASSALAAQSLLRNICGFAFPLFTTQMFDGMTFTWASILAALVCAVLAIVPFWLVLYGKRLRLNSSYIVTDDELI